MMIIASDLDRTLIYSKRAIEELSSSADIGLKPVEKMDGKWISFMTKVSFSLLQNLCRQYLFVPITTRTIEQYQRISIFQEDIQLPYAVTTNGAVILRNGTPMVKWSEMLSAKMKEDSAVLKEIYSYLKKEGFQFNGRIKQVEELFFYYILESPLSSGDEQILKSKMTSFGWRVSLQGRKLYFIPQAINKGDALEFICNIEGKEVIAGSGDSNLDWDFLNRCRFRLVPNHGELVKDDFISDEYTITKNSGILAGEEILNQYLSL